MSRNMPRILSRNADEGFRGDGFYVIAVWGTDNPAGDINEDGWVDVENSYLGRYYSAENKICEAKDILSKICECNNSLDECYQCDSVGTWQNGVKACTMRYTVSLCP